MNGLTTFGHFDAAERALTVRRARVLLLGYGNPGRQDDGLGPAAAAEIEKLEWPGVTVCDNYQLVVEDAIEIAEHDVVWFVDAARTGAEPYEVRALSPAFDVAFTSSPGEARGASRHRRPMLRQVAGGLSTWHPRL